MRGKGRVRGAAGAAPAEHDEARGEIALGADASGRLLDGARPASRDRGCRPVGRDPFSRFLKERRRRGAHTARESVSSALRNSNAVYDDMIKS